MATAGNHPIHTWINKARKYGGPSYLSNLENIIKHFPEYMQIDMEHITAYIRSPWWKSKAIIMIISMDKEEMAKAHQERLCQIPAQDLIIYTDGSNQNGHIGAAIYSPTCSITKGKYMGTDDIHIVYAAELMAIQMTVTLFEEKINEYVNVHIFSDSQAAIQIIESPKHQSGQYIIKGMLDKIDSIHEIKSSGNIYIEWISDHKNVQGNELADQAAKIATTPKNTRSITRMKSAQNRSISATMKINWETEWKTDKENARHLRKMSKYPDTVTGLKLYGVLQRKYVVLISRL